MDNKKNKGGRSKSPNQEKEELLNCSELFDFEFR